MKRRMFVVCILSLLLSGCSQVPPNTPIPGESGQPLMQQEQLEKQEITSASEKVAESEDQTGEPHLISEEKPKLAFEEPELSHWILGECAYEDGYIILYQCKKHFYAGEYIYTLEWQQFDQAGKKIGQGDANRKNSIPLYDLSIENLRSEDGTVKFTVQMPKSKYQEAHREEVTVLVDEQVYQTAKQQENVWNDDRYLVDDWYVLSQNEEFLLEYQLGLEDFCLTLPDITKEFTLISENPALERGFYELLHPDEPDISNPDLDIAPASVSWNAENKSLDFSIDCMAVHYFPYEDKQETEYHYTAEMLQTKIAESPDGTTAVYTANEYQFFEGAQACDFLLVHPDGEIQYLYSGEKTDPLFFLDNERYGMERMGTITFYEIATGEKCEQQPQFDYGTIEFEGETIPEYRIVGLGIDEKNQRLVAAYRRNNWGREIIEEDGTLSSESTPVYILVMDFSGKVLLNQEAGFSAFAYGKFTMEQVEITTNQMGEAVFEVDSMRTEPKTLTYPIS